MSLDLLLDQQAMVSVLFQSCFLHLLVDSLELILDLLDLAQVHLEHDGVVHQADGSHVSPPHERVLFPPREDVGVTEVSTLSVLDHSRDMSFFDVSIFLLLAH